MSTFKRKSSRWFVAICFSLVAGSIFAVAGCNKDARVKSEVIGKVSYKGQPVSAPMTFNPDGQEGSSFTASSGADGSFTFKGVSPGSYTITLLTGAPTGPAGKGNAPNPYNAKMPPGA